MRKNISTTAKQSNSKIFLGTAFVNVILVTSLIVSVSYWFVLSGLESSNETSLIWTIALYSVIALGICAELTKKVAISLFRHKGLWLGATAVSILTIMGSLAITENNKQASLIKASDSYQLAQSRGESALNDASKYAFAASYNLPELEKKLEEITDRRAKREMRYATYIQQKKALVEKIEAKRGYDAALGMSVVAGEAMAGGGSASNNTSANPLLDNIAKGLGIQAVIAVNTFYLAVTILLEYAALFVGGKVDELKKQAAMTRAELLDIQNMDVFGFSVAQLSNDVYNNVNSGFRNAVEHPTSLERSTDKGGNVAQDANHRPFMGFVSTDSKDVKSTIKSDSQSMYNMHVNHTAIEPTNGKKGEVTNCPKCSSEFTRKTYNHRFCTSKCRDDYHNDGNEVRGAAKRANIMKRK